MTANRHRQLVRMHPPGDTLHVSQGYTSLATDLDGFVGDGAGHGLFVHETRLLSRYRWLIEGAPPLPVALSNVEQHTWMGYYIAPPPGDAKPESDSGSGQVPDVAQHTIELRLSRFVGDGLHEDVDLTNFTQQPAAFTLAIEAEADFADQAETRDERKQCGTLTREWRETDDGVWELIFDYRAEHEYDHQGDQGTARIHRGLTLRIENATSPPSYTDGRVVFRVVLDPQATWHTCINMIPRIESQTLPPLYGCRSFEGTHNEHDRRRDLFLDEATGFSAPGSATLAHTVISTLEQAKRDLAALRLYDLDHGERAEKALQRGVLDGERGFLRARA